MGDPETVGEEKVDLEVLKQIAQETNGASFEAMDTEALAEVYARINELEPEKFDTLSFRPRTSAHHYPIIFVGMLYLVALTLVNIRFKMLGRAT